MSKLPKLLQELKMKANPQFALGSLRFIKAGKGEYGEKMKFLGIKMADLRQLTKKYESLNLTEIGKLLKNKYHEIQIVALLLLIDKYKKNSNLKNQKECLKIYKFYLTHTKYINSWGLVDLSASAILGDYLLNKNKEILEKLAKSKSLWEKRIAVVSTLAFINKGESKWTFKIVKILLNDPEDLIHKACGWMLREVGKQASLAKLEAFLTKHKAEIPRTMLRYAIERFPEEKRSNYLKK